MPQITLKGAEFTELVDFIKRNKLKQWYVAKDHGAYVGANADGASCIFYFRGCNPLQDEAWWETCQDRFGGDDFGEMIDTADLLYAAELGATRMVVKLTPANIVVNFYNS